MRCFERHIILCALALTGLLVLAGCDTMTEEPEPRIELEPHAVGNRWDYLLEYFSEPDTFSLVLDRKVMLTFNDRPRQAFIRHHFLNGHRIQPDLEFLYANGEDGIYQLGAFAPSDTILFESLAFPYPAQVGDTGTFIRYHLNREEPRQWEITDTLTVEVISTDEQIETPAGTFSSYLYKYYLPEECASVGNDIYVYYVLGVGRVAQIARSAADFEHVKERRMLYAYEIDESNNKARKKQHAESMLLRNSIEFMYDRNDLAGFGTGDPGFDDTRGRVACNAGG